MPKLKVLFIDEAHPLLKELLENAGFDTDVRPLISQQELLEILHNYTGIIIRSRIRIDKALLDCATKLRFIGRLGAGMESIDTDYATLKKINCFNSPEGNRDAVGEHTIMLLLALMNKLVIADAQIHYGIREREANRGFEIKGKTIAIIGYGNMGQAFAQRLSGFETNVIAYDKYKTGFSDPFVKEVQMQEIFDQADILSLHVPLTSETKYLVDGQYLNNFKKNIWLVNTARGPVVNTTDLAEGIKSGKVLGAALDVIEYENLSFESLDSPVIPEAYAYLLESEKVILTPHIAGWTFESKIKLAQVLADKIITWSKEQKLI